MDELLTGLALFTGLSLKHTNDNELVQNSKCNIHGGNSYGNDCFNYVPLNVNYMVQNPEQNGYLFITATTITG